MNPRSRTGVRGSDHSVLRKTALRQLLMKKEIGLRESGTLCSPLPAHRLYFKYIYLWALDIHKSWRHSCSQLHGRFSEYPSTFMCMYLNFSSYGEIFSPCISLNLPACNQNRAAGATRSNTSYFLMFTSVLCYQYTLFSSKYRVIKNDCRGFNNFSYTIHLTL